jgi:hypothetical protein
MDQLPIMCVRIMYVFVKCLRKVGMQCTSTVYRIKERLMVQLGAS